MGKNMSDCWEELKVFFGIDVIITSCFGMHCSAYERANIELRLISKALLRWIDCYTVIMIIIHAQFLRRGNNIVGMPKKKMKMTKKEELYGMGWFETLYVAGLEDFFLGYWYLS